jgi:chromosome segregation ATPase
MANKNKKIKRLVKANEVALSTHAELVPTLTQVVARPAVPVESLEKTYGFDEPKTTLDDKSEAELKKIIKQRETEISDLEFQIEQSRMRQRGLDEEIKVRGEITADINLQIRKARSQLMAAAKELETLNQKYLQMRAKAGEAESEVEQLRSTLGEHEAISSTKDSQISDLECNAAAAISELEELRSYVEGRKSEWHQRDAEFAVLQTEMKQLQQMNRELKASRDNQPGLADRCGEDKLKLRDGEIDSLRKDNTRIESYANELRIKLQDQIAATQESTSMRQKLEENLDVASRMINDLTTELEQEKRTHKTLAESFDDLKTEFARETRQIRFELTTAQQTITDQDTTNQQLTSDLMDHQDYRQALETHVDDVEKENSKRIEKLEKELAKARVNADEYEHKLRVKDGAIADLMKELANQSSKLHFTGELENALQKIDGARPAPANSPRKTDRTTRQLIGSADGKELRFPLFRKRLSIGRTKHNDIQLDLRFVSRRHAVIATDNNATRVIDWGSRNGVYVNKKRVTEKILKSGDVVTIGLTNLRYEERVKR